MSGLRQYILYLPVLLMGFLAISCGEEPSVDSADDGEVIEVGAEDVGEIQDQVHHAIPSPNEMMEIIRASGKEFKGNLMCDPEIHSKFVDLKGKSMGMGIYIADLAYAVSFNRLQESLSNFNVIGKLSNEIGIGATFDEQLMDRIKNNLGHEDSLAVISDQSYYGIIAALEENDQGGTVGMIAAGGFLESMFIATQVVDKFDAENPLMKRIADQKLVYENIMAYLDVYNEESQAVEWTMNDMESLKSIFSEISDNRMDTKFKTGKGGKKVLGGKGGVYITEQEFEELRDKVAFLRDAITFNPHIPQ